MKLSLLIPLVVVAMTAGAATSHAQSRIFRCGNTYTNNAAEAKGCKPIEGGHVTVVEGTRPNASSGANSVNAAGAPVKVVAVTAPAQRVDSGDQRARDSDARLILAAELKKAEARQTELVKEYSNGEPEKLGPETRNYQKYLDRVAELKASIARNDTDIAGIKRELGRVPAPK